MPPVLDHLFFGGPLAVLLAPFVGSFAGTLAERLPLGHPVVAARSRCPHCGTELGWRDLVPLASFVALRGRCRHCGGRIAWFHPLMELGAIAIALMAAAAGPPGAALWLGCLLGWTLLALAAADALHFTLPDVLTLPLLAAGLAAAWLVAPWTLGERAIGAAAGFLVFWLIAVLYRRWRGRHGLGLGDAKLLAAAGAWVGWPGLPSVVLLGAVLGLVAALAGTARGRRLAADQPLPFGTFLAAGTWLVWLYGPLAIAG